MKFKLVSLDKTILEGWEKYFSNGSNFEIVKASIWAIECDVLVLSGDSFGIEIDGLWGGADMYGTNLQYSITSEIIKRPLRELLVGESILISDFNPRITNIKYPKTLLNLIANPNHIIYAPSWRAAEYIDDTVNIYLYMKAILIQLAELTKAYKIDTIAISVPGLINHQLNKGMQAAFQMKKAYDETTYFFDFNYPRNAEEVRLNRVKLLNEGEIIDEFDVNFKE